MGDQLVRMEITGWREVPLYSKIKVVEGVLSYGDVIGKYSIVETNGQEKRGEVVALLSTDNSMDAPLREKIPKGSEALIKLDAHVEEGDTGVFSVNGMTVIRVLKKEGKYPLLEALNEKYPATQINENDEFYTIGRVVEVCYKF